MGRELAGEDGVAERHRGLLGDRLEEPQVGVAEGAAAGERDADRPEHPPLESHREGVVPRFGRLAPGARERLAAGYVEPGDGTGRGDRPGGGLRDGRQQGARRRSGREPPAERGQRLVGLCPAAVREPVGEPDQAAAQGLERQRDHGGAQQRQPEAAPRVLDQPAQRHDEDGVADGGERDTRHDHDRAVDDHVELVELVSQHGDREQDREQEVRHEQRERGRPGLLVAVPALHHEQPDHPERRQRGRQGDQPELLALLALAAVQPDQHRDHRRDETAEDRRGTRRSGPPVGPCPAVPRRCSNGSSPAASRARRACRAGHRTRSATRRTASGATAAGRPARGGTSAPARRSRPGRRSASRPRPPAPPSAADPGPSPSWTQ